MKLNLLRVAIAQLESEIASDRTDIVTLLCDPSGVPHDLEGGISYAIHSKLHHLGSHLVALYEAAEIYEKITGTAYELSKDIVNYKEEEDGKRLFKQTKE